MPNGDSAHKRSALKGAALEIADTMTSEKGGLLASQERIGGSVEHRKPSIEANWLDEERVALLDVHANTDSEDIESEVE